MENSTAKAEAANMCSQAMFWPDDGANEKLRDHQSYYNSSWGGHGC